MIEIKGDAELNKVFLGHFTQMKCLVFLSDELEVSRRFETGLKEAHEEFGGDVLLLAVRDEEVNDDLFSEFGVESVPTVIFLNANLSVASRLKDASPAEALVFAKGFAKTFATNLDLESAKYDEIFPRYLLPDRFVFFDFANKICPELTACRQALEARGVSVKSLSIAPFKEARGATVLAQLAKRVEPERRTLAFCYVNGKLIGSLAELEDFLSANQALLDRLRDAEARALETLLLKNPVLLVYDSSLHAEKKESIIEELQKKKVMFSILDTINKPFLRKLVADKSNLTPNTWPALLLHSHDPLPYDRIIQDLESAVDKKFRIENTEERIKTLIASHPIFVFMKGSPEFPQCGFTRQIVEILAQKRVSYGSYSILSDPELREKLKEISNWKTYPQVYVNGELLGGLDIIREMDQAGELDPLFKPHLLS